MLKNAIVLLFICHLSACTDKSSTNNQSKPGDRLLADPEHYVKDSPEITKFDSSLLYTGLYYIEDVNQGYERKLNKSEEIFYINPKPIVTAQNLESSQIVDNNYNGERNLALILRFDKEGTEQLIKATQKMIGKKLAFILDNRLIQVAIVNSQITDGTASLSSNYFTRSELENYKVILDSER